jgi:hypothetical protein
MGVRQMYAAVVEPSTIARVLGLCRKVNSIEQLDQQVEAGLPKVQKDPRLVRSFFESP